MGGGTALLVSEVSTRERVLQGLRRGSCRAKRDLFQRSRPERGYCKNVVFHRVTLPVARFRGLDPREGTARGVNVGFPLKLYQVSEVSTRERVLQVLIF